MIFLKQSPRHFSKEEKKTVLEPKQCVSIGSGRRERNAVCRENDCLKREKETSTIVYRRHWFNDERRVTSER